MSPLATVTYNKGMGTTTLDRYLAGEASFDDLLAAVGAGEFSEPSPAPNWPSADLPPDEEGTWEDLVKAAVSGRISPNQYEALWEARP